MRGQTNVVATTLIITIAIAAATTYYIASQGIFTQAAQESSYALDAKMKTERFLQAMGGQIYPESNTVAHFVVQIYNSGDVSIPYSYSTTPIRWYLYKDGVMVAHGASGSLGGACAATIPPGTICTYDADVATADSNLSGMYLILYVNEYGLRIPLNPVPFPGVSPFYVTCDSCDSCNSKIAALSEENRNVIVFVPSISSSGDCLDINGKSNIIISCLGSIKGSGSGTGITISRSTHIDIRNCDISSFNTGILIEDSNDLSFSSVYSHDNASLDVALSGSIAKSCQQGDWDLRTTRGRLLLVSGTAQSSSEQDIGQVSAVWAMGADGYWLSAAHASGPAGFVDPIVLVCNSKDVRVSALNGSSAPRGIILYADSGTQLDTITVSNVSQGILSYDSNGSSMYDVNIGFSGDSLFHNPESFEWQDGVTFHS